MKKRIIISIIVLIVVILSCFILFSNNNNQNPTLSDLYSDKDYNLIIDNYKNGKYTEIVDWKNNLLIAKSAFQIEDFLLSKEIYDKILSDKEINDLERAEILYNYSMTLVKLKYIDDAFTVLQEGINECSADLTMSRKLKRSYGLLSKSFPREYNIENALLYLKDAIDLDITGADYEITYAYALMLYYAEMYDEALIYNQKTLKIKFDYLPAEKLMPKIYFESDNVEDAITYLNELNIRYPTDEDNRLYLAQIFELIENYHSAIKTYNETLLINEKNIDAHMGLIRCYISENKINALLNELKIFLDTFPEDNKYQEIIDKLIEKYMPKLITDEKDLEDIISKNE